MTFYPSANQNPGRMNLFDFQTFKVLLDYGHNPESARAMAKLLPRLSPGRKIALCHGTGNRTDEQLIEYGEAWPRYTTISSWQISTPETGLWGKPRSWFVRDL